MARKAAASAANSNKTATKSKKGQTLYQKVDNIIRQRLIDNVWKPGDALPSEMQLASELDVSQGTVRKALNDMVTENLLYRRQGLGTFVSEHTERRALFLYFSIVGNDGTRLLPESNILSCEEKMPTTEEAEKLQLSQGEMIVQFRRIRFFNNAPAIVETISLPLEHFPGFGTDVEPPNNLFRFYQSAYGVTVAKAEEHLKAVSASAEEAELLGISEGAPLLEIDRIAKMLDDSPVEWRVSHCDTSNYRYVAERG
ncbi:MAG: GntR family transcriptional regulator [Rhodospirillaceae bacterium]|nr:GntR family transcriptional regulator [Rhodospirillaceae bacterium]MBT7956476.1 GntR family transcriptional regulator [Rhodospirillaceae bacterium]